MTRQLPIIFGQRDYLQQLGTTGGSIHDYGCYLTTFATLARACGKIVDPVELNKLFIEKNVYAMGNLMYDDNLTKVFPDIVYQKTYDFPNEQHHPDGSVTAAVPADLSILRDLLKDPTIWVIIKISIPPPLETHFALVTGLNGTLTIADPISKQNVDFAQVYGNPETTILKYVVYKGNPAKAEDDTARIERDKNWNVATEVISHLGVEITPNEKDLMVQKAKEKIDSYLATISGYTKEVEELKKKYDDEYKYSLSLKAQIEEEHKQDKNYGQEALDAQHKASSVTEGIQKIAATLDLQYDPTDDKKLVNKILAEVNQLRVVEEQRKAEIDVPIEASDTETHPLQTRENGGILKKVLALFFSFD